MKRWSVVLLVLLLLAGCGAQPTADGTAADEESGMMEAGERAELDAAMTEAQARPLTEEEILDAYDRAVTAYGWFDLQPLPTSGESQIVDGQTYRPVDYPGMENLLDLQTYLKDVFCEEIVENLLDEESEEFFQYLDINGALYGPIGGRSRDRFRGEIRTQVEMDSETTYLVYVSVDVLDQDLTTVTGMESYVFPYEQVNGRWVFTQFQLVY